MCADSATSSLLLFLASAPSWVSPRLSPPPTTPSPPSVPPPPPFVPSRPPPTRPRRVSPSPMPSFPSVPEDQRFRRGEDHRPRRGDDPHRGAKARRVLYVVNQGSDSGGSSDDDPRRSLVDHGYPSYMPSLPPASPDYFPRGVPQPFAQPTILTSNFNSTNSHYQGPPLSSPSSTSSPAAEESTPPPSTPAVPNPPVDLSATNNSTPEMMVSSSSDRSGIEVPQPTTARVGKHLPPAKPAFGSRNPRPVDPTSRRPKTSPTVPAPDSNVPHPNNSPQTPLGERVLIVVTSDTERYVAVDVSGAPHSAYIRECIFNKFNIYTEEEQAQFSIFQTEIGDTRVGKALSDEKLFTLCRDHGDSKGSLKFFVTVERSRLPPPIPQQPAISSMPSAVFMHGSITPPRLKQRRTRHGSVSSTASEQLHESATGYEADLDNPEKESHRCTLRPSQQVYIGNGNPPSPQHRRVPNSSSALFPSNQSPVHLPRSLSPPPPPLTFKDKYGHVLPTPPPPPPLSPARAKFPINDDSTYLPPPQAPFRHTHGRSGSDAAEQREQAIIASEQQLEEAARWKSYRQHMPPSSHRLPLGTEPPREALDQGKDSRQWKQRTPSDGDDWQHISPPGREYDTFPSSQAGENSNNNSRISPSVARKAVNQASPRARPTSPYATRPLIPPAPRTQPPPIPPQHPNESSRSVQRPAGIPVPGNYMIRFKAESKVGTSQSSSQFSRLGRVNTKSMDNLRPAHPQGLQSGGGQRRHNPLPASRPARDHLAFSPSGLSGTPKSYESSSRLPINNSRPHPTQYNGIENNLSPQQTYLRNNMPYSNSIGTTLSTASNADPFPRPQSAAGDTVVSPSRYGRQKHSPTYGSTLDPHESARSPRGMSPGHHGSALTGPRPPRPSTADRATDYNSGVETSHSTPPQTPVTPQSPKSNAVERDPKIVDDTSPRTYVPERSSETTLRQGDQDHMRMMQLMRDFGMEDTVLPPNGNKHTSNDSPISISITTAAPSLPPSRGMSPPPSTTNSTIYDMYHDDSSDAGHGTWIRKPKPLAFSEEKPKLKVHIESAELKSSPASGERSTGSAATLMASTALPGSRVNSNGSTKVGGLTEMMMKQKEKEAERQVESEREMEKATSPTYADDEDGWAMRPPPEAVYERLERYFGNHDLDKPVIEATSGGTSPTSTEPAAPPQVVPKEREKDKNKMRAKKSIRYVAEDAKRRIDRTSKADSTYSASYLKKRSTKFWGGRLEEVTTHQAKSSSISVAPGTSPESSSNGETTTFKWVRGELLGKGTYGKVYLAMNATTGEMIAVKQVELPQTASDKYDSRQHTVVRALKMESETLKHLDHPNIVQYLGFEETTDNLSIFLEYVPGGSIGSCLHKHGRFNQDVTKSFTSQILSGLEYLHDRNILHRDLKADNILVQMSGVCKISDFGISKRTDDEAGAFTAMQGTVFWMAPEVVNTQKKGYNSKIDIWSVGCVVLEMWAGMRPWIGEEMVAVMFKLYQNKLPPPVPEDVHLSPLGDDFRKKCFAINPEERPSASELRKHEYLVLPPSWQFNGFT